MQYDYERFTPDRFQEFCQALVVNEFPDAQCYPVGQKDGGRDAYSNSQSGIVLQVKFKRDRLTGDDSYKILKKAIDDEAPKVQNLADRGASSYILITNLVGTAALDVGSMDRVAAHMNQVIPLPSQVWWRADIDARLNSSYDLKWNFSEIITSGDMLRLLIEEGLGENSRRRMMAITGYITSQYDTDEFVKFKQADLQANDLLSLFIDVPVSYRKFGKDGIEDETIGRVVRDVIQDEMTNSAKFEARRDQIGGATLLLHSSAQAKLRRIVIEGAPGQGKSTLAQYVCQTYRMKFLEKTAKLDRIPPSHRLVPIRIPFKVDLRDLSSWLHGVDPSTGAPLDSGVPLSLESFLASQIRHASGGQSFSVDDLDLFLHVTPSIIFLDGLDEVASIAERKVVIDAVNSASNRMLANSPNVQIAVTSRPAAVANMPRFSSESWAYLSLEAITSDLIYEYTDRWSRARNITPADIDEIKRILRVKLASSHIKDLARNAMQLTILLNLVHVRGQALPDHRTELYDSYVEVFFNREADKSKIVREHRQLLINLHGFLAWKMHSAAEVRHTNGRVTEEDLKGSIYEFLSAREYSTDIIDDLLNGVVQRIVALVSRVEGTFEFEVQPLREYFAARHLYDTAPYSPSGRPQQGTKPEIFEAIAPNPYWLNVTRFYAGCYSVGELPGLADQLEETLTPSSESNTSFPRAVATSLLADRVFSQAPRVTTRVVKAAVDPLTLRYALHKRLTSANSIELSLADDCGSDTVNKLFANRVLSLRSEAARSETGLVWTWVMPDAKRLEEWYGRRPDLDGEIADVERWVEAGLNSQLLSFLQRDEAAILADRSKRIWSLLVVSGSKPELITGYGEIAAAQAIANADFAPVSNFRDRSVLLRVLSLFRNGLFFIGMETSIHTDSDDAYLPANVSLQRMISDLSAIFPGFVADYRRLSRRRRVFDRLTWLEVLRIYEAALGRTWLSWNIAILASEHNQMSGEGLRVSNESIHDSPLDFIECARARRGHKVWWSRMFAATTDELEKRALSAAFLMFATPACLRSNIVSLQGHLETLSSEHYISLLEQISRVAGTTVSQADAVKFIQQIESDRTKVAIAVRFSLKVKAGISSGIANSSLRQDSMMSGLLLEWTVRYQPSATDVAGWFTFLDEIRRLYEYCSDALVGNLFGELPQKQKMPAEVAQKILEDPDLYPSGLIMIADQVIANESSKKLTPVAVRAVRQKWAASS